MPLTSNRVSYQLLNDADHRLSLERIARYGTRHLVILSDISEMVRYPYRMTKDHPALFERIFVARPENGPGPAAIVFRVDLDGVRAYLAAEATAIGGASR